MASIFESTVRYLGIEVDDALSLSEQVELVNDGDASLVLQTSPRGLVPAKRILRPEGALIEASAKHLEGQRLGGVALVWRN